MTGEFPAQKPSDAENISIWWRHALCAVELVVVTRQTHARSFVLRLFASDAINSDTVGEFSSVEVYRLMILMWPIHLP